MDWLEILRWEQTDPDARAEALRFASDEDVLALLALAQHADASVREALARALPWLRSPGPPSPAVLDAALLLTADDAAPVRDWACFAFRSDWSDSDTPHIRAALRARLDDADPDTRGEALLGLALRHDPAALPAIPSALHDSDPDLRRLAMQAAGALSAPELHSVVLQHLSTQWSHTDDADLVQNVVHLTDPRGLDETVMDGVAELYRRRAHHRPDGEALAAWHQMEQLLNLAPHRAPEFFNAVLDRLQDDRAAAVELVTNSALASLTGTTRPGHGT